MYQMNDLSDRFQSLSEMEIIEAACPYLLICFVAIARVRTHDRGTFPKHWEFHTLTGSTGCSHWPAIAEPVLPQHCRPHRSRSVPWPLTSVFSQNLPFTVYFAVEVLRR